MNLLFVGVFLVLILHMDKLMKVKFVVDKINTQLK